MLSCGKNWNSNVTDWKQRKYVFGQAAPRKPSESSWGLVVPATANRGLHVPQRPPTSPWFTGGMSTSTEMLAGGKEGGCRCKG